MTDDAGAPLAWEERFIAALRAGERIRPAARSAGISSVRAYAHRKRNARFAEAWRQAQAAWKARQARRALWRETFFHALAETSNVSKAAAVAGVSTALAYGLRRTDREFAGRWRLALREGYDNLELELLGQLRDPQAERRTDVAAGVRLLAAHRATVERERAVEEEEDVEAVRASLVRYIRAIRVNRAANAALIEAKPDDGQ
jgi:hypothetical protein